MRTSRVIIILSLTGGNALITACAVQKYTYAAHHLEQPGIPQHDTVTNADGSVSFYHECAEKTAEMIDNSPLSLKTPIRDGIADSIRNFQQNIPQVTGLTTR